MLVDVLYEGLALAKGANAREEGQGAFVELEAPMPVGTRLTLRSESGERLARVERVQEGATSGVVVRFLDASAASTERREAAAPSHVEVDRTVREEPRDPPSDSGGDDKRGRKEKRGRSRRNTSAH